MALYPQKQMGTSEWREARGLVEPSEKQCCSGTAGLPLPPLTQEGRAGVSTMTRCRGMTGGSWEGLLWAVVQAVPYVKVLPFITSVRHH